MPTRCVLVEVDGPGVPRSVLAASDPGRRASGDRRVGLLVHGAPLAPDVLAAVGAVLQVPVDLLGLATDDPNLLVAAAAGAGCFVREVAVAAAPDGSLGSLAVAVGALVVPLAGVREGSDPLGRLDAALDAAEAEARRAEPPVGVGPHPEPWPDDDRLDPALLAEGDRRNVVDGYRYWREAAIVADLDGRRHAFHVAVENWQHDLNIGTVVRNANAFNAAGVHIVGKRRWNRRGAMATDRYLAVAHHPTVDGLASWAAAEGLQVVGVDNVPGAVPLEAEPLPERAVLVFGQEGPGLSDALLDACASVRSITQFGSTRSLNAGVASGIAMHAWCARHAALAWPRAGTVL